MAQKIIFVASFILACLFSYQLAVSGEEAICWHGKGQNRISSCSKIINSTISVPEAISKAHRNRGREFAILGHYQNAIQDLSIAISRNPERAELLIERGNIYRSWNRLDLADADFKKALQIDPALQDSIEQIPTN